MGRDVVDGQAGSCSGGDRGERSKNISVVDGMISREILDLEARKGCVTSKGHGHC
jgi:hypothetical protein